MMIALEQRGTLSTTLRLKELHLHEKFRQAEYPDGHDKRGKMMMILRETSRVACSSRRIVGGLFTSVSCALDYHWQR